jgi:hypothetical protein
MAGVKSPVRAKPFAKINTCKNQRLLENALAISTSMGQFRENYESNVDCLFLLSLANMEFPDCADVTNRYDLLALLLKSC